MNVNDTDNQSGNAETVEHPRVTVIIPTFNRESVIARALDCVLNQTFEDFEIIVCDDASTDSTREVVRSYLRKDSRIKLLCLPKNQGSGASRNLGMKEAQGQYIAFLDDDDEWWPEKLERQIAHMDKCSTEAGVCFCGAEIIQNGDSSRIIKYVPQPDWERDTYRKFALDKIGFLTPTILFRRSYLALAGFMTPEMRRSQDVEFLLRLFRHAGLTVLPDCLVTVNLVTMASQRRLYWRMKDSYPFLMRHRNMIKEDMGYLTSVHYQCIIQTKLIAQAVREHYWKEALSNFWNRICVFPFFWPKEYFFLLKGFAGAIFRQ